MDYDLYPSKIMERQSTIGSIGSCSSRLYYGRLSEGKAFEWEARPGKAITPQPDNILPPLSPPPAVLAMGLPKPCFDVVDDEPKAKKWSSAWLVKKFKKTMTGHYNYKVVGFPRRMFSNNEGNKQQEQKQEQEQDWKFESQRSYDHHRCESARYSSSSFASTLTCSSSNSFRDHQKTSTNGDIQSKALFRGKPFTCNPRGLSDMVVFFVKKS
ncbi:uncharacterized protein [Spinacia oleracea]|uniref:Uncharacterized protein n=1 Tax=Spinacia oleracea TaxID=3562 RepID=A0A9R0HTN9_SPIOL|nr:uncharacterized protein LOC110776598 [Spinacia oleracea]